MVEIKKLAKDLFPVESSTGTDVKSRLMQAGLTIFGTKGLSSPTVRDLTDAAGCNVSSISYYFGSRDDFLKEILVEVFSPIRKRRDQTLAAAKEKHHGGPVPVTELVEAWIIPLLEAPRDVDGGRLVVRFMQQLWAEPAGSAMAFIVDSYDYGAKSYIDAFSQSLPVFTQAEIVWRYEMMRGAALHAIADCDPLSRTLSRLSGGEPMIDPERSEAVLQQIVQFCAAGFATHPIWSRKDFT